MFKNPGSDSQNEDDIKEVVHRGIIENKAGRLEILMFLIFSDQIQRFGHSERQ